MYEQGTFSEIVVWRVPEAVPPSKHRIKYRMLYIVEGRRIIGFDNKRGTGDHRHLDGWELPYRFIGIDHLLKDFVAAVELWRRDHGQDGD